MSDSTKSSIGPDEPAIELEMSAQDLLAVSPPHALEEREQSATPSTARRPTKGGVMARAQRTQPLHTHVTAPSTDRRMSASRVALSLSVLMAAVTVGSALYMSVTPDRAVPSSSMTMLQQVSESEWSAATSEPEGEPVRFANPFDKDEVFEFSPGTSEGEARDAVADVLLKRAMERQAHR